MEGREEKVFCFHGGDLHEIVTQRQIHNIKIYKKFQGLYSKAEYIMRVKKAGSHTSGKGN